MKTYTDASNDVTIVEIKKNDKIDEKSFFDLDNQIFQENAHEIFKNCQIYLLHYLNGLRMEISPGVINNISIDNKTINHFSDTSEGSSGSPIINKTYFQVIGIHKGSPKGDKNYNLGTLLKEPIENFKKFIGEKQLAFNSNSIPFNNINISGSLKRSIFSNSNKSDHETEFFMQYFK